jgi:hypothetical protein
MDRGDLADRERKEVHTKFRLENLKERDNYLYSGLPRREGYIKMDLKQVGWEGGCGLDSSGCGLNFQVR